MSDRAMFHESIVCCYLYVITKYGYPPPAGDTERHLEEMASLGFRSVEMEGIREDHLLEVYGMRHRIRERAEALNLSIPYFCTVLPGLSSTASEEREKNLALFQKGCETAEVLGAKGVLDNGPLPPYRFPDDIPVVRHYDEDILMTAGFPQDLVWASYWRDLTKTYRHACDIAAAHGLTYQLHPCLGVLTQTTDGFLRFADAVARDGLRFNLDTANQFVLKDSLALSLMRLRERIDYIHLSDNGGMRIEHLPPGDGSIHWDVFFNTLKKVVFRGYIGLDIGGSESDVADLNKAYQDAARWLEERWFAE